MRQPQSIPQSLQGRCPGWKSAMEIRADRIDQPATQEKVPTDQPSHDDVGGSYAKFAQDRTEHTLTVDAPERVGPKSLPAIQRHHGVEEYAKSRQAVHD